MQAIEVQEYRCRRCEQKWDPRECYSPEGDAFTLQEMNATNHYKRAVRIDPVEALDAGIEPAGNVCPCCLSRNVIASKATPVHVQSGAGIAGDCCPIRDIPLDGPPLEAAPCLGERCGFFDRPDGRCAVLSIAHGLQALAEVVDR